MCASKRAPCLCVHAGRGEGGPWGRGSCEKLTEFFEQPSVAQIPREPCFTHNPRRSGRAAHPSWLQSADGSIGSWDGAAGTGAAGSGIMDDAAATKTDPSIPCCPMKELWITGGANPAGAGGGTAQSDALGGAAGSGISCVVVRSMAASVFLMR
jgi:hypothetical protein